MQDLWRAHLDWDEQLPPSLAQRWHVFKDTLPWVSEVRCPRWIGACQEDIIEIHGFGDASKTAYAAVLFVRLQSPNGICSSRLLTTKTRVAPVKTLSIPRLELCAAVLLARLLRHIIDELKFSGLVVHAWSDSLNVLHWINTDDPSRWPTFVANRVSEIQNTLPEATWHYVSTKDNPADIATRGADPRQLASMNIWWNGPEWLSLNQDDWPHSSSCRRYLATIPELIEQPSPILNANVITTPDPLCRFSSLTHLKRIIAWCLRWKTPLKPREERLVSMSGRLQPQELQHAFLCCVIWTQLQHFPETVRIIRQGGNLPKKDVLTRLHPFVDSMGVLRVGGRLSNSSLPYDQKHPVILPGDSHLATLLIDWAHQSTLHGGYNLTYSLAVRRAWIIRERVRVKAHLRKCVTCVRRRAKTAEQLMGNLPAERVTAARPFEHCGVDYAGPFALKASKGREYRTVKGYIALFVCLCTKTVHLEVVGDLTTDSFLAVLRRFMGRRGMPSKLWSDNATTFRGADAELRSMLREAEISWNLVQDTLANQGIQWSFIPPSAPHFGGLWEAGIKTAKSHLKTVVNVRNLTYEEMTTLATQVEVCMNSRPLIPIEGDLEDLDVLTPGHALIGAPLLQPPDAMETSQISASDTHWKLVKKLRDNFWTRWSQDYLHTLQQRTKWSQPKSNLRAGNLVLIVDQSLTKFNRWPLGRVVDVYPGRDGLVRAAKVRTASGLYDRPIHKLCLLPIPTESINHN